MILEWIIDAYFFIFGFKIIAAMYEGLQALPWYLYWWIFLQRVEFKGKFMYLILNSN